MSSDPAQPSEPHRAEPGRENTIHVLGDAVAHHHRVLVLGAQLRQRVLEDRGVGLGYAEVGGYDDDLEALAQAGGSKLLALKAGGAVGDERHRIGLRQPIQGISASSPHRIRWRCGHLVHSYRSLRDDLEIDSLHPPKPSVPDEPIRLTPYDPSWPGRFEEERAALDDVIGEWIVGGIHHVGSTAVPGLVAKPIIDILAGVRDLDQSRACFEPLARLGYMYAPYLSDEMHWFCKPHPSRRTHHLHLVPAGSKRYADELAFRDRLRADPTLAAEYADLKRNLASRFRDDREGYTDAKAEFVGRVLKRAP